MNFHRLFQALDHSLHHVIHRVWRGATHRIGQGERVHVALGRHALDHIEQWLHFRAGRVDGEKDGVQAGIFRGQCGVDGRLDGAVEGPPVRILDHVLAGGDLDHHTAAAACLDGSYLIGDTTAESKDFRFESQTGDVLNRRFVLLRDRGHSRFNAVNSQRIELARDSDLLFAPEDHSGLLFAVTQSYVVNLDLGWKRKILADLRQEIPGACKPLVCLPGLCHRTSI